MKRLAILSLLITACLGSAPRDLSDLVVSDRVYVLPSTRLPYSGRVFRAFPDGAGGVQLEGELLAGTWDGEFKVYHPNGRIRYMGSFVAGEMCGPWTENADSVFPGDLYEELVAEIESMGIYPPCSKG